MQVRTPRGSVSVANISRSRKSGLFFRGGRKVRETLWTNCVFFDQTIATVSTAVLVAALSADGLALRPFTIVRTRGLISIRSDQVAAGEIQAGAFGACVVSDQASAIGVSAVPTPVTDSGSDAWYVYERLESDFTFASGSGFAKMGKYFQVDSRAMRKVEDGFDNIQVIETEASGFSAGVRMRGCVRYLFKLH